MIRLRSGEGRQMESTSMELEEHRRSCRWRSSSNFLVLRYGSVVVRSRVLGHGRR